MRRHVPPTPQSCVCLLLGVMEQAILARRKHTYDLEASGKRPPYDVLQHLVELKDEYGCPVSMAILKVHWHNIDSERPLCYVLLHAAVRLPFLVYKAPKIKLGSCCRGRKM